MKTRAIVVVIVILFAAVGFWSRSDSTSASQNSKDLSLELEAIDEDEAYSYKAETFDGDEADPSVIGEELANEGIRLAGEANIELFKTLGGASFVQKYCGDISWKQDIEDMMEQQDPEEQPALKAAFELGWAEAEKASQTETIPCESL